MNARVQRLLPVDIYSNRVHDEAILSTLYQCGFFAAQAALLLDDDSLLHRHIGALGLTAGCNNVEHCSSFIIQLFKWTV